MGRQDRLEVHRRSKLVGLAGERRGSPATKGTGSRFSRSRLPAEIDARLTAFAWRPWRAF